jgi:hypothetical protein
MFVLTKETNIDGYYSTFDRMIACSNEFDVIENLESTLHEEKEIFMSLLSTTAVNTIEAQTIAFQSQPTLSKYFSHYIDITDDYFNFEITQVEEI